MTPIVKIITEIKVDVYQGKLVVKGYTPGQTFLLKDIGGRYSLDAKGFLFPPYVSYAMWIDETFTGAKWTAEALRILHLDPFSGRNAEPLFDKTPTWETLYPYQREAVNFLHSQEKGALLALSPGLGKTAVSLVAADMMNAKRVLVAAPLSLLRTWEKEAARWSPGRYIERRYGLPPLPKDEVDAILASGHSIWQLTNYDTIVRDPQYHLRVWDVVILDESILLKNRKTKRFAAIAQMCQFARRVWLLSGSPTSKFADELWTQLNLIDPAGWPSYWRFVSRFCYLEESQWGKSIAGTREERDIQSELRDILIVRNQKDVLPDLPEMIFQEIDVDLYPQQIKVHQELLRDFMTELDGEEMAATNKMTQLMRLQQVTSNLLNLGPEWPNLSAKDDEIQELIDNDAVELPVIIWTHWQPGADDLHRRLTRAFPSLKIGRVHGQQKPELNEIIFEKFKEGNLDILILALEVGKFGHTLTNARTIIYKDKTWSADAYYQSLHRVKRIGLTHSPRVITLRCEGTVDDLVEQNLAGKLASIAQVSNADLRMLLNSLGREMSVA